MRPNMRTTQLPSFTFASPGGPVSPIRPSCVVEVALELADGDHPQTQIIDASATTRSGAEGTSSQPQGDAPGLGPPTRANIEWIPKLSPQEWRTGSQEAQNPGS